MLTFAARPKSSVFGSHSTNIDNSSSIMGQGGGGTSRLKRLSWMLHPSRQAQSHASDGSPLSSQPSSKKSVKATTREPTSKTLKDAKLLSSSVAQENSINLQSIAMPNATPDTHKCMTFSNTDVSPETDADTSTSADAVPDTESHLTTTVHISTATTAATSASTSNSSSNVSDDASPTDARKSSISFPTDLPKPEHPPSIPTPVDAPSESSCDRKSSVSSVSFRRSRNTSVSNSLHKQASNSLRLRPASPPPQR
ncbi:hypothetical protein E4U21_001049 [Claviceps maximensis]|nr:hypothetical protein E4U21_001049 [Claviceps maximensis]